MCTAEISRLRHVSVVDLVDFHSCSVSSVPFTSTRKHRGAVGREQTQVLDQHVEDKVM